MKQHIALLLISLFLFSVSFLLAVPAYPGVIEFNQPDGTIFKGNVKGDEWNNWQINEAGFLIEKNQLGSWVYVDKDFNLTDVTADQSPPNNIQPRLIPPLIQPNRDSFHPSIQLSVTNREIWYFPLLLIQFPDLPSEYTVEDFDALMNELDWNGPQGQTGSFREYYNEISYDQFDPLTTVAGWFTSAEDHIQYGDDTPGSWNRVRQMIGQAIDDAESQGMDWSQFDNDGDGYVDGVNVVHAGLGAEEGNGANIWSHKSNLGNQARNYDGVIISSYSINPEKQSAGYNNTGLTHIGVISHEFGHALGLPDLYDTDYSSSGIGTWGLMSGGAWGGSGSTPWYPSHMCAWSKEDLGWVLPIVLDEEISIALEMDNVEENPLVFRMNGPSSPNQYFLFENRQKIGSDQNLKNSGLLIWHINQSQSGNSNDYNRLVDLEQADGLFQLNSGANDGDLSDPFPGTMEIHRFSYETIPSSSYNNGTTSNIIVTDINEIDGMVSVTIKNMPSLSLQAETVIESAGDGDGIINPGESFSLVFTLSNPSDLSIQELVVSPLSELLNIEITSEPFILNTVEGNSTTDPLSITGIIDADSNPGPANLILNLTGFVSGALFDQILSVQLDISINQAGFPIETSSMVKTSPLVMDLDDDGIKEIVFGTLDGYLIALEPDGSFQEGDWPLYTGGQYWGSPAAEDMDNDGTTEIVIGNHNGKLFIIDPFAEVEQQYQLASFLIGTPAIGHLNSNDFPDVVIGSVGENSKLFAMEYDSTIVNGFPIEINENMFTGAALADFNGDELDDIVIATDSDNLYLYNNDGELFTGFPFHAGDGFRSAPIITNVNGDENLEILVGNDDGKLYCINTDGSLNFYYHSGFQIRTSPGVLEYDEMLFIVYGDNNGMIYMIDAVGSIVEGWPLQFAQDIYTSPLAADVDSDGSPEIISAAKSGEYIILNMTGVHYFDSQLSSNQITEGQATISDFDQDGDVDIFIGNLAGLDGLDIKTGSTSGLWSIFRGNNQRTGFFMRESSAASLGDVNEDGEINISDVIITVNIILGDSTTYPPMADINNDGIVNISDVVLIVAIILT